ncbi:MAG: hypothetical protein WBX22_02300 [Silvibacterium sp.]
MGVSSNPLRKILLPGVVLFSLAVPAVCQSVQTNAVNAPVVPQTIKYDGVALEHHGVKLEVAFRIYPSMEGGDPLWSETQSVSIGTDGKYSVFLGADTPGGLPQTVFVAGQARWLGISIAGAPEQTRVPWVSVAYAMKAADAETLGGLPVSAFMRTNPSGNSSAGAASTGTNLNAASPATASAGSAVTGSGRIDYIPMWTGTTKLGTSIIFQAGGNIGVGIKTPPGATVDAAGTGIVLRGISSGKTGLTNGVSGEASSTTSYAAGVSGFESATTGQVWGVGGSTNSTTNGAAGVSGYEGAATGQVYGVSGNTNSTTNGAAAVNGGEYATSGVVYGVNGATISTTNGAAAVNGYEGAATGVVYGVQGNTTSTTSYAAGVKGIESAATGQVFGVGGATNSTTNGAAGVSGYEGAATGQVYGVSGNTNSTTDGAAAVNGGEYGATGVVYGVNGGTNSTTDGAAGVNGYEGASTGRVYGVNGSVSSSTNFAAGVSGYESATTGLVYGVYGGTASGEGVAVQGEDRSLTGGTGVSGITRATSGYGVGVNGMASDTTGLNIGINGTAGMNGVGVQGNSSNVAVAGINQVCGDSGCTRVPGVAGQFATGTGGVVLQGLSGPGPKFTQVFTVDASGNGYYAGNLNVTGTLSKGGGSFKIDDPLDPANKYLSHSFVESPDMMNVYNGNITTDRHGLATVILPDYFDALNRDFRYQLTVMGQFAQAIVAREIEKNHFVIRTNKPGVKVSWQVTGIRQDAYANANRIPVEEDKPAQERGLYLHPEVFGQPAGKSVAAAVRTSSNRDGLRSGSQ